MTKKIVATKKKDLPTLERRQGQRRGSATANKYSRQPNANGSAGKARLELVKPRAGKWSKKTYMKGNSSEKF